ncbi:MAG: dihydrodipicolinate synthase family protein [Bryobacteraceae bacterium]|jgi:dihydrodipicolinate synthase/N-acetylneuraminate lyase
MSGGPASKSGPIAAAITPRNRHEELDFGAAFELIDFLCRSGVAGIALFTAIGEYASLTAGDRSRLLSLAVKRSRVPIYAGIGAATLDSALGLARDARDAGAAGLFLPPPHGFAYAQDDIREFYLQFAAHVEPGPPVYLIASPGLSSSFDPRTAYELLATGSFAGLPDSVSEIACATPELTVAQHDARNAGRKDEVARIDAMLGEFTEWEYQFPPTVAIKTAVSLRGIKTGPLPVPLTAEKLRKLEEFRAWFKAWLPTTKKLHAHA